jgi:hypothetical protein
MAAVIHHPQPWSPPTEGHKRGHSASAISFRVSDLEKQQEQQSSVAADVPPSPTSAGHSINLKPYWRKLSLSQRDNSNVVDLSRSYAENQSIAGLAFFDESRSASDLAFSPSGAARSLHKRSTSNNSNFSISSGQQRPTAPYAYPMRHTPRPYTPPIARSYTANSSGNSDASDEADDIMSDEDFRSRQRAFDPSRRSGSIGSLPIVNPQPYQSYSNSSLTRLNNVSNSSLPTSRSRGDTMRSVDTVPSSRTSMERAIGFFNRSTSAGGKAGVDEPVDAASRAATIQAARMAYAEREEAKERKAEKEHLKQQGKAERKKRMKEERTRRKSESGAPTGTGASAGAGGVTTAITGTDEKLGFVGRAYDDYEPSHTRSLPYHVPTVQAAIDTRPNAPPKPVASSSVKSRWLGFVAWFRTRLLRMKRKLKESEK